MIARSTNVLSALRSRQRGFLLNPARFAAGGGGGDPSFSSVSLLCHFNGANGATTTVDSGPVGHTLTAVGNAQLTTSFSKFGGAASIFDGSGDSFTVPDHASLDFGSGDLTIEGWVRITSGATNRAILKKGGNWPSSGAASYLLYWDGTSLGWYASSNGTSFDILSNLRAKLSPAAATWIHVALARSGSSWRAFADGVLDGSATSSATVFSDSGVLSIGDSTSGSVGFNGQLDDLRITKGVARYTANFTPPAAQFPDS